MVALPDAWRGPAVIPSIAVAIELATRLRHGARTFAAVCLDCAAAVIGVADGKVGVEVMTSRTAGMPLASDAYVMEMRDDAALGEATTNIPPAWSRRPLLKSHGLGPFSEARTDWLGRSASSLLSDQTYAGCVDSIDLRAPAGRGRTRASPSMAGPGAAATGCPPACWSPTPRARWWASPVRAAMPEVGFDHARFRLYARVASGTKLRLFTVSHDGRALCEVGPSD